MVRVGRIVFGESFFGADFIVSSWAMDQLLPGQSDTISIPSLASLEGDMIALLSSGDDSFLEDADLDPKIECSINLPYSVIEDTVKSTFDDKLGRCSNTADVL